MKCNECTEYYKIVGNIVYARIEQIEYDENDEPINLWNSGFRRELDKNKNSWRNLCKYDKCCKRRLWSNGQNGKWTKQEADYQFKKMRHKIIERALEIEKEIEEYEKEREWRKNIFRH